MFSRPVIYYVSAHGYGHGARSCDLIRALKRRRPSQPIYIVSGLGEAFFKARLGDVLGDGDGVRAAALDLGMVQRDSIQMDVDASLGQLQVLSDQWKTLVETEREYIAGLNGGLVIADIPAIPLAAAARAGIPGVAVGNFSWDWIYQPFAGQDSRWQPIVEQFRAAYGQAELLLKLPFAPDMSGTFRRIEEVPLLASPGTDRRTELAACSGADPIRSWVLLSFTALNWNEFALANLNRLRDYEFFSVLPLAFPGSRMHALDPERYSFKDVLASMDIVLSKPGFGVVSECIANAKPLIYADRADFLEYPILVDGIRRFLRNLHIPAECLYAGKLDGFLGAIADQPYPAECLQTGGAEFAARRIHAFDL